MQNQELYETEILNTKEERKKSENILIEAREIAQKEYLEKEQELLLKLDNEKNDNEKKYDLELKDLRNRLIDEVSVKEKNLSLIEQLNKENISLNSQIGHLKKYSNSLEEKNDDLARKIIDFQGRINLLTEKEKKFEDIKEKNANLEKEVLVLQVKLESLAREEALKREFLEKEFRRDRKIQQSYEE